MDAPVGRDYLAPTSRRHPIRQLTARLFNLTSTTRISIHGLLDNLRLETLETHARQNSCLGNCNRKLIVVIYRSHSASGMLVLTECVQLEVNVHV